jgi:hypothetical protein
MCGISLNRLLPITVACVFACGGTRPAEPPKGDVAPPPAGPEPLCKALAPQFDNITKQFNLGGALICEDVPGVVTLGQFGVGNQLDRSLLACVDNNAQFTNAIATEPAAVSGVEYSAVTTSDASGSIGLGRIAPWLPDVKAASGAGEQLHLRLSVTDATWESLPAVARVFEAQNHACDCLPTLCHDDAKVVYKILRGRVKVEINSKETKGFSTGVTLLGGGSNFALEENSKTTHSVTLGSNDRLVLAIVAKATKAELSDEGQCDGCGFRGEPCCDKESKCDETLTCLDGVCRPPGYPGAPCDNGRCAHSGACVRGVCRTGCGTEGLPCCDKDGCGEGRRCQSGQPARREVSMLDETVERKGGLFGTDAEVELGSAACGEGRLRSRFAITKVEGDSAHCDDAAWMAATDVNDCRVKAHVHVSPFGKVRCRVQVFATEADPQVPKPQALCK